MRGATEHNFVFAKEMKIEGPLFISSRMKIVRLASAALVFSVAQCEHPHRITTTTSKAGKLAKTQGRVTSSVPSISTSPSASPKEDDPAPGEMGQECSDSKPCLQGLKCYLPSPDAPSDVTGGICGCESNDDCDDSADGSQCIETDYLERSPYTKAKLCAQCHPINQSGCDPTSNIPFCDQGLGYVECTCEKDDHCPGEEKCGIPWCFSDIVRSCSLDHDAEWGC